MAEYDYEGRFNYDDDRFSAHYAKHVDAMTRESLHSKSAIAVELAWRDFEVERLRESLDTIAFTETDWRKSLDANMEAVRTVAFNALRQPPKEGE